MTSLSASNVMLLGFNGVADSRVVRELAIIVRDAAAALVPALAPVDTKDLNLEIGTAEIGTATSVFVHSIRTSRGTGHWRVTGGQWRRGGRLGRQQRPGTGTAYTRTQRASDTARLQIANSSRRRCRGTPVGARARSAGPFQARSWTFVGPPAQHVPHLHATANHFRQPAHDHGLCCVVSARASRRPHGHR